MIQKQWGLIVGSGQKNRAVDRSRRQAYFFEFRDTQVTNGTARIADWHASFVAGESQSAGTVLLLVLADSEQIPVRQEPEVSSPSYGSACNWVDFVSEFGGVQVAFMLASSNNVTLLCSCRHRMHTLDPAYCTVRRANRKSQISIEREPPSSAYTLCLVHGHGLAKLIVLGKNANQLHSDLCTAMPAGHLFVRHNVRESRRTSHSKTTCPDSNQSNPWSDCYVTGGNIHWRNVRRISLFGENLGTQSSTPRTDRLSFFMRGYWTWVVREASKSP